MLLNCKKAKKHCFFILEAIFIYVVEFFKGLNKHRIELPLLKNGSI